MKNNLIAQVHANKNKPMLTMPSYYKAFKDTFDIKAKQDYGSNQFEPAKPYQVVNGIGIIDFKGFTVNDCDPIEELYFGVISLQRFQSDLQKMKSDDSVIKAIVDCDSGGGFSMGGFEANAMIAEFNAVKPIIGYTSGLMGSNAYYILSACENIIASPSSWVGSIGVYVEYMNYIGSAITNGSTTVSTLPDIGIQVTTFQGGTEKTVGSEFIPLTDSQKQSIQSDIDAQYAQFKSTVIQSRGAVKDEFMQGQVFTGLEAMQMKTNLIDGLANNLQQIVNLISK